MKRIRSAQLQQLTRARPTCLHRPSLLACQRRPQSTQAHAAPSSAMAADSFEPLSSSPARNLETLPSPPPEAAVRSAKLAALHARLSLPKSLPLPTLARTLIDVSADANPDFNNYRLAQVGRQLLSLHVNEYLMCKYPRLPMAVLHDAYQAYAGAETLHKVGKEWGVEQAAYPGGEVDPGLLQFSKAQPDVAAPKQPKKIARGRAMLSEHFGEVAKGKPLTPEQLVDKSYATFVRALVGAIFMHSGRASAAQFIKGHILSRKVDLTKMFYITRPPRHLNRLCAREGFEYPVARILAETGRQSRHPVYVVGVYSGTNKLGEGAAGNLNEARVRAAVAALKAWYLYSPTGNLRVPSETEMSSPDSGAAPWKPVHVDIGEIVA